MNELKITKETLPCLGVHPEKLLSDGFELEAFEFCLRTTQEGCSLEFCVTGEGTDERREFEAEKVLNALGQALREIGGTEFADGLRTVFKDGNHSLNDRKIEIPDDWQKLD